MSYISDGRLLHAYKVEGAWATEAVDTNVVAWEAENQPSGPSSSRSGWSFSMNSCPIAAGRQVHIAYIVNPSRLQYAVKADGKWSIETVDDRASEQTTSLSLALDIHEKPRISYCGYPSCVGFRCSLKYASRSSGVWHVEAVDSTKGGSGRSGRGRTGGYRSALRLHGNVPHIVASTNRGWEYTLRYAGKETQWWLETITNEGGEDVAMALDPNGNPVIAWPVDNALRCARRLGPGEWRVDGFHHPAEPTFSLVAVAVDARDNVHIAHCYEGGMRYVWQGEPGNWEVETVDEEGYGVFPWTRLSLALDDQGHPHVGYIGANALLPGTRFIKYAYRGP